MQRINAFSLAPDVITWLAGSNHPRILHVFDHACNLINERREVLSIVTPQIGNGPFNLVIEDNISFSNHLQAQASISIQADQLHIGNLTIDTGGAKLWSPLPDWEMLHTRKEYILDQLSKLPIINYQFSDALPSSLAKADLPSALTAAKKLAGLGQGLTPAGDDFIMGAILAVWIIHPPEVASVLAEEIERIAAALTTSLSAAWLRSAGRGEAGILWHLFFDSLSSGDSFVIQIQITKLLSIGHTSGADALAGFFGAFISYAESEAKLCPS